MDRQDSNADLSSCERLASFVKENNLGTLTYEVFSHSEPKLPHFKPARKVVLKPYDGSGDKAAHSDPGKDGKVGDEQAAERLLKNLKSKES